MHTVLVFFAHKSMLCEVSETLTEWKSESVMDSRTDRRTGVGARDACASKISTGELSSIMYCDVNKFSLQHYCSRGPCGRACCFRSGATIIRNVRVLA